MRFLSLTALLVGMAGTGCATYEFDLVRPPELTRHIGRSIDAVVQVEPLEYRMRSVDNRLVVRVFNPTNDPIELVGPKCSVVDPNGQSHPLPSQSIAPGSFVKLIFPPMRPRVYDPYYGPTWNTGMGAGGYYRVGDGPASPATPRPIPHPHFSSPPRYLVVYDDGDPYYWDWKGQSEVRAILAFRQGETEFRHEFVFRRRKV
jgi:hypothetical protein